MNEGAPLDEAGRAPPGTLAEWLRHCERIHPVEIDLTLDRVKTVAQRLGLTFRVPVISVAGTNGKGSSCAMLESIALAAGLRVGLYSKPHLCRFEERCRVNGASADEPALVAQIAAVEHARGNISLTFFEHTTLAIMRLLSQQALDLVVLEVGLGGRLDAVNVVDADCALITSIDIDHTEFLGSTREAIGAEKAGIMRPGRPVVVSDPSPPASIGAFAEAVGAVLRLRGRDFEASGEPDGWTWSGWRGVRHRLPPPALRGACQRQNAAGVIAALEEVLPVPEAALREGLRRVRLAGRFEVLPGAPALVLDVAHNPQSVRALAGDLASLGPARRTAAVFGCMRDKEIRAVLDVMRPLVDRWHFTDLPLARAEKAVVLAGLLGPGMHPGSAAHCHARPLAALRAALDDPAPIDRVVVFGSFHTVGGVYEADEVARRRPAAADRP